MPFSLSIGEKSSEGSSPRLKRDNRRAQLLDAAARNFREQGYTAASVRDIATDAGMKAGSMYYYFPSKADLLIALHEEGTRRISSAVNKAIEAELKPWERLEAAMAAHLEMLLDGGDYAQVVVRELALEENSIRVRLVPLRDSYEAKFANLIDSSPIREDVPRQYLRLMILGALNWSRVWYRPGGDAPTSIAHEFLEVLRPLANTQANGE